MPIDRRPFKSGNSLVISLPAHVLTHLQYSSGDELRFYAAEGGSIVLTKRPQDSRARNWLTGIEAHVKVPKKSDR